MSVRYYDESRGYYVNVFADRVFMTENMAHIQIRPGNIITINRIHLLEVRAC